MKLTFPAVLIAASLFLSDQSGSAAESTGVSNELNVLVMKITDKLKDGKRTESELADELKGFDALLAQHKGEKTDDVARVLLMKAMLYVDVLDKRDEGLAMVKRVQSDYPGTKSAEVAGQILDMIKHQDEARKTAAALAPETAFPDFDEKDLAGKPLSVGRFKGKVVLIDFWATWCGPCVAELPNVIKTYQKYHNEGFEIIGISLDQDEAKLQAFIKQRDMSWPQFFDGKGWQNKLAARYGVTSIPATYLLDREGKIIAKDLRGGGLEREVAKALAQK